MRHRGGPDLDPLTSPRGGEVPRSDRAPVLPSRYSIERIVLASLALAVALLLAAPLRASETDGIDDPLEPVNRAVFAFNLLLEDYALDPAYRAYVAVTPPLAQRGAYNFLQNLQQPLVAVSSGLGGDLDNAGNAGLRFLVNSTAGVFGVMDVARHFDLEARPVDLGAALCRHGLPDGPYIVLPLLGPASLRSMTGKVLTHATLVGLLGPLLYPIYSSKRFTEYVEERPELDFTMAGALDAYVRERAIFRQREAARCLGEAAEAVDGD